LKHHTGYEWGEVSASPPTRGRGLKQTWIRTEAGYMLSPPTRGRGLKPYILNNKYKYYGSPPTRGRGLKHIIHLSLK